MILCLKIHKTYFAVTLNCNTFSFLILHEKMKVTSVEIRYGYFVIMQIFASIVKKKLVLYFNL